MALAALLLSPTSLLALSVVLLSLLWWLSTRRLPGLPPGPGPALPLLGHLYMLDKDPRRQFYEWRRQYGDVFSLYMGGKVMIVLSGYATIKEAFVKCADVFSDRPHLFIIDRISNNMGVVGSSGAHWKEQRKTSLEILREMGLGKNVLAEKVQEEVSHYIKALHSYEGRTLDITRLTQSSVSNNICSIIFGKRYEYEDPDFLKFLEKLEENFHTLGASAVLNFFPWLEYLPGDLFKFKKILGNVKWVEDTYIHPHLNSHLDSYREGDDGDFIYAYIREIRKRQEAGDENTTIDAINLFKVIGDLFGAGTETTSTAIRWAVAFFLHNPQVQDKCFDEIQRVVGTGRAPNMRDRPALTYSEATVLEVLRLGNVVPFGVQHGLWQDVNFRGFRIPKDTIVLSFLESVLKDPQVWDQPDTFRPERFIGPDGKLVKPDELIPFGIGRRMCLGESLARMELFLYLTAMIQHFRFLPPEDGQLPSLTGVLGIVESPRPYQVRCVPRD